MSEISPWNDRRPISSESRQVSRQRGILNAYIRLVTARIEAAADIQATRTDGDPLRRPPQQPEHRGRRPALRPHPCTGHSCDHCPTCERLGICCLTVNSGAQPVVNAPGMEYLRSALMEERAVGSCRPSLRELADRQEAAVLPGSLPSGESRLALPPGTAASTVERLSAALDEARTRR